MFEDVDRARAAGPPRDPGAPKQGVKGAAPAPAGVAPAPAEEADPSAARSGAGAEVDKKRWRRAKAR
eukprot:3524455-Pyramimonas_sp.AAC.1